jgi:divalent metal cation (Fe/Co/Zn/Cd) transporter
LAAAIRWCALSIGWALLVGGISLVAGVAASSIALVGFGLDSLVDGAASVTLVWRFRRELLDGPSSDELERRAALIVGAVLVLIALYVGTRSAVALADGSGPESAPLGLVLTGASVLVLPVLARSKLRLAQGLRSPALRADGVLSGAGATLAAATLVGLAFKAIWGIWWGDSAAALLIAATLMREGALALRSAWAR